VIRRCLSVAVNGPYFPDWEFQTLMGVDRDEVEEVLDAWPEAVATSAWESDPFRLQVIAVGNVLNNLLGYPHGQGDLLVQDIGVGTNELRKVLSRWNWAGG